MKINNSFKKILIIQSISAVGLLLLHYFMYLDIRSKSERISVLQDDLSTQFEKQEYLISTEKILHNLESDLAKAQNSIIAKEGDVEFIEGIESIARRNGLDIEIESIGLENQELLSSDLTILNIKAKTIGRWVGTYLFLAEIESLPFKLKVNKSSMISSGGFLDSSGDKIPGSSGEWVSIIDVSILKYK